MSYRSVESVGRGTKVVAGLSAALAIAACSHGESDKHNNTERIVAPAPTVASDTLSPAPIASPSPDISQEPSVEPTTASPSPSPSEFGPRPGTAAAVASEKIKLAAGRILCLAGETRGKSGASITTRLDNPTNTRNFYSEVAQGDASATVRLGLKAPSADHSLMTATTVWPKDLNGTVGTFAEAKSALYPELHTLKVDAAGAVLIDGRPANPQQVTAWYGTHLDTVLDNQALDMQVNC